MGWENSWEGRNYQRVGGDREKYNIWRDNVIDQSGFWDTMGRTMSPIISTASMFGAFEPKSHAIMAGEESYDINTPNREAAELEAEMRMDQANQEAMIRQAQIDKEAMIRQEQANKDEAYRQEMHRMANDRNLAMHNEQGVQQFGEDYSQSRYYPSTANFSILPDFLSEGVRNFKFGNFPGYQGRPAQDEYDYQQSYEKLPQTIW